VPSGLPCGLESMGRKACTADHESAAQLGDDPGLNCTDRDSGSAFVADLTTYFPQPQTTRPDCVPGEPTDRQESLRALGSAADGQRQPSAPARMIRRLTAAGFLARPSRVAGSSLS